MKLVKVEGGCYLVEDGMLLFLEDIEWCYVECIFVFILV